jgi:hypothetical protein
MIYDGEYLKIKVIKALRYFESEMRNTRIKDGIEIFITQRVVYNCLFCGALCCAFFFFLKNSF